MSEESQRDRLPFEPKKNRKKAAKTPAQPSSTAKENLQQPNQKPESTAVPEVVSKRMVSRIALFCGIPTALGILTFIVSYVVVSQQWLKLPNVAVVLVSMGFFGLGVLGLSYGVISASWDEEIPGSKLGWKEFTTNWGRLTSAWRSAGQKD
ncbi:PAM68 family protein [Cyanobacteria bacterium FACHB-472]|nr:PAM68 family protein [Cyanobacteria bacterium FACHB-472]